MRRSYLALLVALLGLTLLPTGGPATASCAAPSVEVTRVLAPGAETEATGRGFTDGCADVGSCTVGCGAHCDQPDPGAPLREVRLLLRQGDRTWTLGAADADEHGRVHWSFALPDDVRRGRARLLWDGGDPQGTSVRVTAG